MEGDDVINAMWELAGNHYSIDTRRRTQNAMKSAMVEILKGEGYFVCETTGELRELAIDETDLVEPNAE